MGYGENTDDRQIEIPTEWERVFAEYRPGLSPNKRTGEELIEYVRDRYAFSYDGSDRARLVCELNAAQHLVSLGVEMVDTSLFEVVALRILDEGAGSDLYRSQVEDHREYLSRWGGIFPEAAEMSPDDLGGEIMVFIEKNTSFFSVECSPRLLDELTAFRGLDEDELENPYLVWNYVRAAGL